MQAPIYTGKSRIDGKNADVRIYHDRIEWEQAARGAGWNITALALACCTIGISLIWMRPQFTTAATQMVPGARINGVSSRKDGPMHTTVTITSGQASLRVRLPHEKASEVVSVLSTLAVN